MTHKRLFNISSVIATAAFISGLLAGCMEKDLYDPNYGKDPVPDPGEYFGFETRGDVKLSVNYDLPGLIALLEVYDEDPMETVDNESVKKEGIEALFKIYTDKNGKYEGKMNIPTSVESICLYTSSWGVPRCVKLDLKDGLASLDMSKITSPSANTKAVTRSYNFSKGSVPYTINSSANLYSLCKWGNCGLLSYIVDQSHQYIDDNPNPGYITHIGKVGAEDIGVFTKRMMQFFGNSADNSELVRESGVTNISVKQDGTTLDVVFLNRSASYNNTFGYYYYKTGEGVDPAKVKKYIVFPNVMMVSQELYNESILKCGDKVRLCYFGEDGKASQTFPKGYTVGWFIYADGYNYKNVGQQSDEINIHKPLLTSNPAKTKGQNFITVKDTKSGRVIIGVEDAGNKSYCDLLFYVDASSETSVDDSNRPNIPDNDKPIEEPDAQENLLGTLAFEDIWPNGGDYDMNDVVVEYCRATYFDSNNMINKIVDTFTPTHDGAMYENAFAYQIDKGQFGKVTSDKDIKVESEISSIIVFPSVKQAVKGKVGTYTITRTFDKASFNKENLKVYNPYIIVGYAANQKNRTEVHLPKHEATAYADASLIGSGNDAYYIDSEGAYPFAIDIPMSDFVPVTETHNIDTEYPYFKDWADSGGAKHTNWYKEYRSPQK